MAEIAGLTLITPSSVAGSGVSVSASGKVTFTAATTVSVNGVFDSTYDNYLVVCWFAKDTSGTGDVLLRLRASGSDNSTSNSYVRQQLDATSTSVSGIRVTSNITRIMEFASENRSGFHLYMYGPYLSQPTAGRSVSASGRDGGRITDASWTHNQSTAYDGFTLSNDLSAAWSGTITIYGLSQ